MITKETARKIYNCYQQIEEIAKIRKEMCDEVQRVREREAQNHEPIPENSFGRFGKGMQLGVPNDFTGSMRIFNISPETAIQVMDEQESKLKKKLHELEAVARIEMSNSMSDEAAR
ncbi:MAG: hypothetical protein Q4D56_06225 [Bacteroides sp.]|nr:hypothetical protein [Bacteroides sp.]